MNKCFDKVLFVFNFLFCIIKYTVPVLCALYASHITNDKVIEEKQYIKPKKSLIAQVLVTNQFSKQEKDIVEEAAFDWTSRTKGVVNLKIVYEPFINIDFTNSVLMLKSNEHDPDIIIMDSVNNCNGCIIAITSRKHMVPYIKIVDSRVKNINHFYTVVLHEIGHYIGLNHLEGPQNIGTVMYPVHIGFRRELTVTDLKYFCEIYMCTESKKREILSNEPYNIYLPP